MKTGPQRYFDGWASKYDRDLARYDYAVPQTVFDAMKPRLTGRPLSRMLDIGIGTGLCSAIFRLNFPDLHITGIDVSQNMIDACRNKGLADRLYRLDAVDGVLPPGPYEGIVAAGVLEFMDHADDLIEGIARHLASGGYAALAFETPATVGLYRGGLFSGVTGRNHACVAIRRVQTVLPIPHVYTKYLHSPVHVTQLCRNAGLEVVETTQFVAYVRGNGDVVTHDLMIIRK